MVLTEDEKRKKDLRTKKILRIAAEAEISVETVTVGLRCMNLL